MLTHVNLGEYFTLKVTLYPTYTRHCPSVGLMSGQRRRQWTSNKQTFFLVSTRSTVAKKVRHGSVGE